MTDLQVRELMKLSDFYSLIIGHDVSIPSIWFGNHVGSYLRMVGYASEVKRIKRPSRRFASLAEGFDKERRLSLRAFKSYLRRDATADDIIQELSRLVAVPEFISNAIRQDFDDLVTSAT